jgi:hypothetical protein
LKRALPKQKAGLPGISPSATRPSFLNERPVAFRPPLTEGLATCQVETINITGHTLTKINFDYLGVKKKNRGDWPQPTHRRTPTTMPAEGTA